MPTYIDMNLKSTIYRIGTVTHSIAVKLAN